MSNPKPQKSRKANRASIDVIRLDIRSETFSDDLLRVFVKNVAEARRENIAATGKPDGMP
jgi:hypothetical protein